MGFGKSFKREFGKNTGKWASNKVFGKTGWSTPRRHVIEAEERKKKERSEDREYKLQEKERELKQIKKELAEVEKKERIIREIREIYFDGNSEQIYETLGELLINLKLVTTTSYDADVYNVNLMKFEQGLKKLERMFGTDSMAEIYYNERNTEVERIILKFLKRQRKNRAVKKAFISIILGIVLWFMIGPTFGRYIIAEITFYMGIILGLYFIYDGFIKKHANILRED